VVAAGERPAAKEDHDDPHQDGAAPRLLLALAVAGCGGGGKTSGVASLGGAGSASRYGSGQDDRQAALNWARCMRQHGINLPDPQITADGIDEQLPTGMRKEDPRLKAAWRACEQSGRGGT
jgi:hypothetical protein